MRTLRGKLTLLLAVFAILLVGFVAGSLRLLHEIEAARARARTGTANARESRVALDSLDADLGVTARRLRIAVIASAWVMVMTALLAGRVILKDVLAPMADLHAGMIKLREGESSVRIGADPGTEAGEIATMFNALAEGLERENERIKGALRVREEFVGVGRIAPGIAHEINNPLATIAACGEGMLRRQERDPEHPPNPRDTEYLKTILAEVFRCKEMTTRLLEMAQRTSAELQPVDPLALVREVVALTAHSVRKAGLELEADLPDSAPRVTADARRIRDVLLNLILNAAADGRAIQDGAGNGNSHSGENRKVRVKLEVLRPGGDDPAAAGAGEIRVSVSAPVPRPAGGPDSGPTSGDGIRLVGDGLGLTLAAAVIQAHGGTLSAPPGDGGGTVTHSFTLPAAGPEEGIG